METRIENLRKGKYSISKENTELLFAFDKQNEAEGLAPASRLNYLNTVTLFMRELGKKHISKASQEDVDKFLQSRRDKAAEQGKQVMPATEHNYRTRLCFFAKWLNKKLNAVDEYPHWVKHLREFKKRGKQARNDAKIVKLNPELLLNPEEVLNVVRCAGSTRAKSLLYLTFDSGCRINEILHIRKNDIEFNERYCKIKIRAENNKNRTERDVFISRAVPVLNEWIAQHHFWNNTENPYLFVEVHFLKRDSPLTKGTAMQMLMAAAKKAVDEGLLPKNKYMSADEKSWGKHKITLHGLRHSRVTEEAIKGTPIAIANKMFGWSKSSPMYLHYTDIVDTTVEEWFKQERLGIKSAKLGQKEIISAQTCPKCGKVNGLEKKMCICGWIFDAKEAEQQKSLQEQINELRELIKNQLITKTLEMGTTEFNKKLNELAMEQAKKMLAEETVKAR